jgi:predicted O-linked N-acetylglucosamine transferase (SPINDLY family)
MLARAVAVHQSGDLAQAEFLYKLVLQADKKQFDALHMLGVIEGQRGNFSAGLIRLNEALRVQPKSAEALINLGRMQAELGNYADAVATYKKALALLPQSVVAHNNMSIALRRLARREEALAHCDNALKLMPDYVDAWNNRGNVLFDLGRFDEALAAYDRAAELQPNHAQAHLGRGNVLAGLSRHDQALAAYDRALAVNPKLVEALFGRGNVLHLLTRHGEAVAAYDGALVLAPNYAEYHRGRGEALASLRRPVEAIAAYDRALAIDPGLPYVRATRLFAKWQICDWSGPADECARFAAAVERGDDKSQPFIMLAASASPAQQLRCAERYVADKCPPPPSPLWRGERYRHQRIRVGYLSGDFRLHPVALLLAEIFEAHDRTRFETTAISFGPDTGDEMRIRLNGAFDRFIDVRSRGDREIAQCMRELELDIAVDLSGFTAQSRPNVLAQRSAPVQVNYLGYSGTMGAGYMDYIIADRTVIAPELAAFYSEKIAWLPDTFMANGGARRITEHTPARRECGLPDVGFVFCCFNNAYKITPEIFDIWMRLLQATDGSVLWLNVASATAQSNLRREVEQRGVSAQRLIFAPMLPDAAEHLARQRQADLFLDTLPYNAHTTAGDALWAGLPVLTCLGSSFAGRVAGSLLRAVGLAELVVDSLAAYEALALKLATEPTRLAALKAQLARNRESFPLFDAARFTRNIEAAYTTMWQRQQRGEPPENFSV